MLLVVFASRYAQPTYSWSHLSHRIQLYTCQSPFSGLSDPQVYSMVLNGKRPERPSANEAEAMSDALWDLATWCWSDSPSSRPTAEQALGEILAATGGVMSPHLGEPESPIPLRTLPAPLEQLLVFLRLEGVQRVGDTPIVGGRSSDIFIGKYRGQRVALRRFRMFLRIEGERKLYEVLVSHTHRSRNSTDHVIRCSICPQ